MKLIFCILAGLLLIDPTGVRAADGDTASKAQNQEPKKILMIGNSLTYTWNIPKILESFAAETGRTLTVTPHVGGGKDLAWHWVNAAKPSGLTAKEVIAKGGYDLVVVQEFSNILMKPEGRDSFAKMLPEYLNEIRTAGMAPLLYMAHPTRKEVDGPGIQPIVDAYTAQSDALGLVCAPVAMAFVQSNEKLPTLALMDIQTDRKYAQNKVATHQSPFGSYLAACTLYAAIYNQSPVGLKFHAAFDAKTEIPIDPEDAAAAQEIAWQVWQEFRQKHPVAAANPGN